MRTEYTYSTFDDTETDNLFPQNTKTRKLNIGPLVNLCETSANGLMSVIKYVKNKIYQRNEYTEIYNLEVEQEEQEIYQRPTLRSAGSRI